MNQILDRLQEKIGRRIGQNESLLPYTTLKEEKTAEYFLEANDSEVLIKAVGEARELGLPVTIMGSGSFLSLPNQPIRGLVIKNNTRKFDKISMRGTIRDQAVGVKEVLVQAESGTLMNQLVRFTIEEGLEGLEYQLGLPGTVGGAIITDAKFKRYHVRDVVQAIRVLTQDGTVQMILDDFEKHLEGNILLSVIFRLTPASKRVLWERGQEAGEYRSNYKKRHK